jgi:hypothetical protein
MCRKILLCLTMLVFGCASPRYLYVDSNSLQRDIDSNGKIPVKRYVLSPDNFPNDSMTFIFNEPTKTFLHVLKKNNAKKTQQFIQSPAFLKCTDSISRQFCLALSYFLSSSYDSCTMQLDQLNEKTKSCFLQFLKTDCEFEKTATFGNGTFDEFVEKYQKIFDCNDNPLSREIVKNRIKLIRYGY